MFGIDTEARVEKMAENRFYTDISSFSMSAALPTAHLLGRFSRFGHAKRIFHPAIRKIFGRIKKIIRDIVIVFQPLT